MPPTERAVLELLGLAARSRSVVAGTEQVRGAVRAGSTATVVLAADTSPTQRAKLTPLLDARGIRYHIRFGRAELGAAIGRAPVSAVGVTNSGIAKRVSELIAALPSLQD